MKKFEIRWLCSCFVVRESAADAAVSASCSSIHEKKAVDISSKHGGIMGDSQSKRGMFLWRFLKRITKRKLWPANLLKDPEDGPAPGAHTSKNHHLMEIGSAKTAFHSINLKPEVSPSTPGISSHEKQLHMMMMSIPPAFIKRRHLNPRKIRSSSVFAWTRGPRRFMEDFVVMDGTFLGQGSYGSVRLCSNKSTGHLMACKTIDKVGGGKNVTEQQACMIRREVKMHQLCSDHPNVVQMLGLFEDDAAVHILMEYCDAGCLSEILQQSFPQGIFSVKAAAVGMKELAEALCWIHGKNIVHRDIKPENILVAAKGRSVVRLKVADFGIALQLKPERGTNQAIICQLVSL